MSLSREEIDLIDGHFDQRLDQNEKETFDLKYRASDEFKEEVDLRNNLIKNVAEFREEDLRKQFTAHMHVLDEEKKERNLSMKNFSVAASFLLILTSVGIYLTVEKTPNYQEVFNAYYAAYDGIALSRNQNDQVSEGRINYLKKNYQAALLPLLKLEPYTTSDLLMIGICYLETDQPILALEWFSKIEADATQDIAAVRDWYIALAHLKNGAIDPCKAVLMRETISNSIYSKRSKALLNEDLFHE